MPDAAISITDQIIGRSLIGAEAIVDSLREEIIRQLEAKFNGNASPREMIETVREILARAQPVLIEHLSDTDLASWIAGMDVLSKQFPAWLVEEFQTGIRSIAPPPAPPANRFKLFSMFEGEPKLRFPLLENAAQRLSELNILNRNDWDNATADARNRAFMITGNISNETIEKVRDVLVENINQGTSLSGFREQIGNTLESSGIGPGRIENIYRTNVQAAFRDGKETLASDPIVQSVFPYKAYLAVHDKRTRSNHLALESLGLNGTNIYRSDDEFWNHFSPPLSYNCRCGTRLMTVEAAARAGVKEAQLWLQSGRPPENPEYRYEAIPFENQPGFGARGRVGVLV